MWGEKSSFFWELFRKTVHLSSLAIVIGYTLLLNYFSDRIAIMAMTALLLIFLEIEYVRLQHKSRLISFFNGLFREKEKDNIAGNVFMVISCIICFSAFDYYVALLALLMTVFGDIFAAIFGRLFGKTILYNNKTFIGTFAGLSANLIVGILLLPAYLPLVIPMAFTASYVEFTTDKLDDNLTVPLFAGFVGQLIVYYSDMTLPPIDFSFFGLF